MHASTTHHITYIYSKECSFSISQLHSSLCTFVMMHGLRSIERMGDEALVRTHISNIVDMAGIQYWYQIDGESSLHHANILFKTDLTKAQWMRGSRSMACTVIVCQDNMTKGRALKIHMHKHYLMFHKQTEIPACAKVQQNFGVHVIEAFEAITLPSTQQG